MQSEGEGVNCNEHVNRISRPHGHIPRRVNSHEHTLGGGGFTSQVANNNQYLIGLFFINNFQGFMFYCIVPRFIESDRYQHNSIML